MIWLYSFFIVSFSLALTIIDLKTMLLPNYLTFPMIVIGFLISAFSQIGFCTGLESFIGLVVGYLLIWIVNALYYSLTRRDGIGMGDAKLLSAFGAIFGWTNVLPILFIASVFGLIGGILWLKLNKLNHQNAFPFGPYICIAGNVVLFDIVFKIFYIKNLII